MAGFSTAERVAFVEIVIQCGGSISAALRKIRTKFGGSNAPSLNHLRDLFKKFKETGSVCDRARPARACTVRTAETVSVVQHSVNQDPTTSVRRRSQELNLSKTTLHQILRKDCILWPYKIQLTQELKTTDHAARRSFSDWMLDEIESDPQFFTKIIFSDEAHFLLNGFVNKQNCRIWASENPRVIVEQALHPAKVTVWCGIWAGGVIGPYFFEDEEDEAPQIVTGERYRAMITSFLWPKVDAIGVADLWYQQDGAPCHTANDTIELLRNKFDGRVISINGDKPWPPRSCDLSPLDYFLWGYVKERVYADKPRTIPELKANIRRVIAEIGPEICEKVLKNYGTRIVACKKSLGGHLADIVFHV